MDQQEDETRGQYCTWNCKDTSVELSPRWAISDLGHDGQQERHTCHAVKVDLADNGCREEADQKNWGRKYLRRLSLSQTIHISKVIFDVG